LQIVVSFSPLTGALVAFLYMMIPLDSAMTSSDEVIFVLTFLSFMLSWL